MCFLIDSHLYKPPPKSLTHKHNFINGISFAIINEGKSEVYIWCHGNADTVDSIYNVLSKIAEKMDVSILVWDYPGYGHSVGSPSEIANSDALNEMVKVSKSIPEVKKITLIGRSLGSGVVGSYVKKYGWDQDIILISPFKSIMRLAIDIPWLCDLYKTYDNLARHSGNLTVYHGVNDDVVPVKHGRDIGEKYTGTLIEMNADHINIVNKIYQ